MLVFDLLPPDTSSPGEIVGQLGDALKVRVAAPPQDGKANRAVIRLLAGHFGVDRKRVRIVAGLTSARKTVEVGVDSVSR